MDEPTDHLALDLFERVCDLSSDEREALLRRECERVEGLRERVLELLLADSETRAYEVEEWVDRGLKGEALAGPGLIGGHPERIGSYRILGRIAVGGMGVVFEAEQDRPRRRVALKVLRPLLGTPEREKRLRREAEVLGRLQHPGIAQILEAGTFEFGGVRQPYLAMEFIEGVDLVSYAERERLDRRERLRLCAEVADAIEYAHSRSVVHRDIKPDNILVDSFGRPKVLDFGVAFVVTPLEGQSSLQTREGQIVGTLAYLAPEQLSGHGTKPGPQTDVYALGVLLYELLGGKLPFDTRGLSLTAATALITHSDPVPLRRLVRDVDRDVEVIVGKALESDWTRRYRTAGELSADLQRHLEGRPIAARPPRFTYAARKFAGRHPGLVGGALTTTLAILVGIVGVLRYAEGERSARIDAERSSIRARDAERDASSRASELQAVASFQAAQFGTLQPASMGIGLRQTILERCPPEERDELDALLGRVDFTTVAADTLADNIFDRARLALEEEFSDQLVVRAQLLESLSVTMWDIGLLDDAGPALVEALRVREALSGPTDARALELLKRLVRYRINLNEVGEARELAREHNRRTLSVYPLNDRHSVESLALRAEAHYSAREYRTSLTWYRRALHVARAAFGDLDLLTSEVARGLNDRLRIDFPLTEETLPEADEISQLLLRSARQRLDDALVEHGGDSPEAFEATRQMANAHWSATRGTEETHQWFLRAYELGRSVVGEEDARVRGLLGNISGILRELGRPVEALPYSLAHMEARRKALGNLHPEMLFTILVVAHEHRILGRYPKALELIEEAWAGRAKVFGARHSATIGAAVEGLKICEEAAQVNPDADYSERRAVWLERVGE